MRRTGAPNINSPSRPLVAVEGPRRPAGRMSETAVLVEKAYDLTVWILAKVEKFPRSQRYGLGERIVARSLDLVEALNAAAFAPARSAGKKQQLEAANAAINSLRILVRLAGTLKLMGTDAREHFATRLEEIGRMAGGWRRSEAGG